MAKPILTEHQFRRLLEHIAKEHLWEDTPLEEADYENAMAMLAKEPREYQPLNTHMDMMPGDEALVWFSPDADQDCALGYDVVCIDRTQEGRPLVRVKDYDAVKRNPSKLHGLKPTEFIEETFLLSRKPKRKRVENARRPRYQGE